jgi:hypothetical protein
MAIKEKKLVQFLDNLFVAQAVFQKKCLVDQDGDNIGEYGYLQELGGIVHLRNSVKVIDSPLIMIGEFKEHLTSNSSFLVVRYGYCLAMYLPGAKFAFPETPTLNVIVVDNLIADNQEKRWCCYAFPYGEKNSKTFMINQTGNIYYCNNNEKGRYSRKNIPSVESALDIAGKNPQNLEAEVGLDGKSIDQVNWFIEKVW